MKAVKEFIIITKKLLAYFIFAYLLLLIFEQFKKGFASNFFNLNYFLIFIVLAGIIVLWIGDYKEEDYENLSHQEKVSAKIRYVYISSIMAVISVVLLLLGIKFLKGLGIYVSIFSGIVIFISALVVLDD